VNGQRLGVEVADVDDLRALLAHSNGRRPSSHGEREGVAPSGFAGGGGDASPRNSAAQGDAKRRRWASRTSHCPNTKQNKKSISGKAAKAQADPPPIFS